MIQNLLPSLFPSFPNLIAENKGNMANPGRQRLLTAGKLVFRSDFDSGNCWQVFKRRGDPNILPADDCYDGFVPSAIYPEKGITTPTEQQLEKSVNNFYPMGAETDIYEVWLAPDCLGTEYATKNRSWFNFTIDGAQPGESVILRIMNTVAHSKLFAMDMRPVYRTQAFPHTQWSRIPHPVLHRALGGLSTNAVLDIPFTFETDKQIQIAFTYPYTHQHLQERLLDWKRISQERGITFKREVLAHTLDNIPTDLITISSDNDDMALADKSIILISCRVHPCETPASFVLDGFIDKVLSEDGEGVALRRSFIFKIIPMLNPDGVIRGHCRSDSLGRNLNRFYRAPDDTTPVIKATKQLFLNIHATGKLLYYCDFHAHHTKRGCFFYGNSVPTQGLQVEAKLFAKIIGLASSHFDYAGCNFSKQNMTANGGKDGTKQDSARVSLYHASGLARCYTMEVNYNTSNITTTITTPPKYTPSILAGIGSDIARSSLSMSPLVNADELPFIYYSSYKTLAAVEDSVHAEIKKKQRRRVSSLKGKVSAAFIKSQEDTQFGNETGFVYAKMKKEIAQAKTNRKLS